ncbi:hypothetical protein LX81_00690 [Palleronia aestuarii]|uniref:Uncharacterized protein n=1 Tax=Palleronia aestuarii TaxID=568105 RepID=A0A2W7P0L1_9RHOB|nr:hypothetical protein [Palleronia aestuarii]PZX18996.1 hypothetical protein LX81_00690 [Palleronia aestuarii]
MLTILADSFTIAARQGGWARGYAPSVPEPRKGWKTERDVAHLRREREEEDVTR